MYKNNSFYPNLVLYAAFFYIHAISEHYYFHFGQSVSVKILNWLHCIATVAQQLNEPLWAKEMSGANSYQHALHWEGHLNFFHPIAIALIAYRFHLLLIHPHLGVEDDALYGRDILSVIGVTQLLSILLDGVVLSAEIDQVLCLLSQRSAEECFNLIVHALESIHMLTELNAPILYCHI